MPSEVASSWSQGTHEQCQAWACSTPVTSVLAEYPGGNVICRAVQLLVTILLGACLPELQVNCCVKGTHMYLVLSGHVLMFFLGVITAKTSFKLKTESLR